MIELSSSPRPAAIVACTSCCDDGGDGRGAVVFGERGGDVAHVLGVELRVEARLVGALEHALAVHVQHAALGEAAEQRFADLRRDRRRRLRARANASATTASVPPITIWLHSLHSWPAPASPMWTTRSGLPMTSSIGFTVGKRLRVAADHDRERAVDGADVAAADRRVEHRGAELRARVRRDASRHAGRDAAHVDEDRARLQGAEDAVRAFEHALRRPASRAPS